jgi:hydrogenase expression/formation protein HypD
VARTDVLALARELKFRDPAQAAALAARIAHTASQVEERPVCLMHVCGSHEQAIARFGLRAILPRDVDVIMGPGCPVCITDMPEVDEAVALAERGAHVATYGDMLRVPGTRLSLAEAQAAGGRVHVVYSLEQAVDLARRLDGEVVFFATGFETTAVATAAVVLAGVPPNFSILSAHKYVPPAMEIVAALPDTRIRGFLAAGHAAIITGWRLFEPIAQRHRLPIVVAGFEPLDILAAVLRLLELVRDGAARVENLFPRCVTPEGNLNAQRQLWRVFAPAGGQWRGIAHVPDGNLVIRPEFAHLDARLRFGLAAAPPEVGLDREAAGRACICGEIMVGRAAPSDCRLFGAECQPDTPVGACMVSSEGSCRIWYQYGGRPDLAAAESAS